MDYTSKLTVLSWSGHLRAAQAAVNKQHIQNIHMKRCIGNSNDYFTVIDSKSIYVNGALEAVLKIL